MHPVVAVCNTDGTRQGIIQGQIIDTFAAMRNASEAARYLSAHANPLNSIIPFRSSHLITVFKRMKDCLDRKAVWGWPPENLLETEEGVAWGERACGAGRIWSRSVSSPASTGRPPLIPSALTLDPLSSACSPCIGGVSLRFGFKVVTRGHWHHLVHIVDSSGSERVADARATPGEWEKRRGGKYAWNYLLFFINLLDKVICPTPLCVRCPMLTSACLARTLRSTTGSRTPSQNRTSTTASTSFRSKCEPATSASGFRLWGWGGVLGRLWVSWVDAREVSGRCVLLQYPCRLPCTGRASAHARVTCGLQRGRRKTEKGEREGGG
eukprot:2152044-Rhodomonas_salina.1